MNFAFGLPATACIDSRLRPWSSGCRHRPRSGSRHLANGARDSLWWGYVARICPRNHHTGSLAGRHGPHPGVQVSAVVAAGEDRTRKPCWRSRRFHGSTSANPSPRPCPGGGAADHISPTLRFSQRSKRSGMERKKRRMETIAQMTNATTRGPMMAAPRVVWLQLWKPSRAWFKSMGGTVVRVGLVSYPKDLDGCGQIVHKGPFLVHSL